MKIWTVTYNDDNGIITKVVTSQAAADTAERDYLISKWFGAASTLPADMEAARDAVYAQTGMLDSVHVTEHDISHHPAIAKTIAAYNQMQDAICDSQDAACNDETVYLMECGAVLVRAALGLNPHPEQAEAAIAPTFGISPELLSQVETESDREEAAYRAAAIRLHHRDGEIEINDNADVSLGDDPGAYVQAWVWVSAAAAGINTDDEGEDE